MIGKVISGSRPGRGLPPVINGSCLCGKVTYAISGRISDIVHCHCVTCRKAHGSAFSSVVSVPVSGFDISGSSNLNSFESSPGKSRYFCHHCGTQVYAKRDGKNNIILRLGSLDSDIPGKELAHTWVSEKAQWYDLNAELPHYEKGFPRN